jgi:hypothetical protein
MASSLALILSSSFLAAASASSYSGVGPFSSSAPPFLFPLPATFLTGVGLPAYLDFPGSSSPEGLSPPLLGFCLAAFLLANL